VPLQELTLWPVWLALRERDDLPHLGVEPLAVAEFLAQPRTDAQAIGWIHAQVSLVEEGVDIRPEQQAVIQSVLAALGDWSDVGGLEDGPDLRSRNRAAPMVSIEHLRMAPSGDRRIPARPGARAG